MRMACDTGGTFTDLIVDDGGILRMYKASTTPGDPIAGTLEAIRLAAEDRQVDMAALLGRVDAFIHGTTRAINAVLTGQTARTAFLATRGHPDILVVREGGRMEPFNFRVPFPEPYVPRALTFELPERVDSTGSIVEPLDEAAVVEVLGRLKAAEVEAVAVCLLWSTTHPDHELRVGELIAEHLPGLPFTLSHQLNPILREYRRASSACIDASLKPLMTSYLRNLEGRLCEAGFTGRVLMVTSQGGVMDAADMAETPIHALNSGPSMAPVAGLYHARLLGSETAIVADTGGTSYDVSLVRRGTIPRTRETWLGQPFRSHMTGFPSVDVRSIGAGGGSIAWVDEGGLLHVGPQSAGSTPGPACYGTGGTEPTVTDCALLLGYIDPAFFLGGRMRLDPDAAARALDSRIAGRLGLGSDEAAAAVLAVMTQHMVGAIEEVTINQGMDPADAVLVGGGGAAGLNSVAVARRLRCRQVIIPEVGAALSAAGALISDLSAEFAQMHFTLTSTFDYEGVNRVLAELEQRCRRFIEGPGQGSKEQSIRFIAEARYPHQVWEIELGLRGGRFDGPAALRALEEDFHALHEEIFAIADPGSPVEVVTWRARVDCRLGRSDAGRLSASDADVAVARGRNIYFPEIGRVDAAVRRFETMNLGEAVQGPAIVESSFTTVVVDPGAVARREASGSLVITL